MNGSAPVTTMPSAATSRPLGSTTDPAEALDSVTGWPYARAVAPGVENAAYRSSIGHRRREGLVRARVIRSDVGSGLALERRRQVQVGLEAGQDRPDPGVRAGHDHPDPEDGGGRGGEERQPTSTHRAGV